MNLSTALTAHSGPGQPCIPICQTSNYKIHLIRIPLVFYLVADSRRDSDLQGEENEISWLVGEKGKKGVAHAFHGISHPLTFYKTGPVEVLNQFAVG